MTNEPRWLEPDQLEAWVALVGVMIRLPGELDRQLRRDAGISHFEYQVLAQLSQAPQRTLRMRELAEVTEGSLPRLSQVAGRLEQRGWLARYPHPDDGRTTLATLTDAGWQQLVAIAPSHVETVRQLVFDPLTPSQQAQLGEIAAAIAVAIDAAPG